MRGLWWLVVAALLIGALMEVMYAPERQPWSFVVLLTLTGSAVVLSRILQRKG